MAINLKDFADFKLPVLDESGKQVYTVSCNSGLGESGLAEWGIECTLTWPAKNLNLLGDSVDPFSRRYRGLITADQLTPACRHYPEWGAVRHFKLRGLDLSIVVSGDEITEADGVDSKSPKRITLHVTVKPDASADSPVALPSRYVDWRFSGRSQTCSTMFVDTHVLPTR